MTNSNLIDAPAPSTLLTAIAFVATMDRNLFKIAMIWFAIANIATAQSLESPSLESPLPHSSSGAEIYFYPENFSASDSFKSFKAEWKIVYGISVDMTVAA